MKFVQIHSFYDRYLDHFYSLHHDLHKNSFHEQISILLNDGFSGMHLFAPYLRSFGYDTDLIVANCLPAQVQWAVSSGFTEFSNQNLGNEILLCQLNQMAPDILYITDPISYDSRFVRSLKQRPRLVVGWRAADIPVTSDFTEFDLMLSSDSGCMQTLLNQGARKVVKFLPGFPEWIAEKVASEQKTFDLVMCGQCGSMHKNRRELLARLADLVNSRSRPYELGYFIFGDAPAETKLHNYGPIWGMGMYRALRKGRIAFNSIIDFARERSGNMRQFEATGVGSFLLTEEDSSLCDYFAPGTEIETYRSFEGLVEKIDHYLRHPAEREKIALKAQNRCLSDHSMTSRMKEFDELIKKHL